ncbi:[acyl-carrier-protein] S-malonyltransferase [bacterium 1xD8-6]|jgi:malonyl CoA-acyl carrier protein transacylase|nr:[acyl-carrier-protein] S-malonyltransferase [bacterium D16-36]RKI70739.1 [acyl-carrier-protein] S-malonyltransferase [bacterium 1xD8-6]
MKTVFMFSGQGAQYAGMGKELYKNYSAAKDIFDRADEVLGYSIKDICFSDEEKLGETEFAQPAILTMSIAAMRVLKEQGVRAEMTAGLSLGEYSAYVASGAMDFEEAVALVQKRGKFMAEAVPSGEGAMYAIIGLDTEAVEAACKEAMEAGLGLAVPANYNAPGQIVIAGASGAVAEAAKIAKGKGAKMAVKLKVSGPFHTEMLKPAAEKLGPELEKMHIKPMDIPVYTNVDAHVVESEKDIIPILTKQICCPVRFSNIIENMHERGADTFIELGPGKALCGFVKRTVKGVNILNVEDESSLAKTMAKLEEIV